MVQLTLPEELLLLIYDDQSGKPMLDSTTRPIAVAGAAVLDLVLNGAMTIVEEKGVIGTKRVLRATGGPHPNHPMMQAVMQTCEGKKPKDAVGHVSGTTSFSNLGNDLTKSLLHDMANGGLLRAEVHGLFNQERFPAADGRLEAAIRQRLDGTLQGLTAPEPRTVGLLAVLQGADVLKRVFPQWDKRELKRRVAVISEGDWAGKAVKDVVEEMQAIVITSIITTTNT